MGLIYKNTDNDNELTLGKFNFSDYSVKTITEPFNKQHLKEIEKAYVPFDKNLDKPVLGSSNFNFKYLKEWNGTILLMVASGSFGRDARGLTGEEHSFIINGYDSNLKLKFQQIMPTDYNAALASMPYMRLVGEGNTIYMAANTQDGAKLMACYGQLDLSSGNWLKLAKLSKANLNKGRLFNGAVMWFNKGFILAYESLTVSGDEIDLQLNAY